MSQSSLDPCAWCGETAVTEVVIVPGRKNKRYQPVCEEHAEGFERAGQMTRRLENDLLSKREAARAAYMKQSMPWMNRKEPTDGA